MACLFCGKDIGPIRILRDREFCSPKHRKQYKDRLQKVLVRVGEPETVPAGMCSFQDPVRVYEGRLDKSIANVTFTATPRTRFPYEWTLAIPDVGTKRFARLSLTAHDAAHTVPAQAFPVEALPFLGQTSASGRLNLPGAKLGAIVLRSADGQLLSEPVALDHDGVASPADDAALNGPLASSATGLALPAFGLTAADCEEMGVAMAPEPAESVELPALQAPSAAAGQPAPPALHQAWMPLPVVAPAIVNVQPSLAVTPLSGPMALRLPQPLSAGTLAPEPASTETAAPTLFGQYLPLPALEPVPAEAGRPAAQWDVALNLSCAAPSLSFLAIAGPSVEAAGEAWMPVPAGEPATCEVHPSVADVHFHPRSAQMPPLEMQLVADFGGASTPEAPAEPESSVEGSEDWTPLVPAPLPPVPMTPAAVRGRHLAAVESGPAPVARSSRKGARSHEVRLPDLETVAETRASLPSSEAQPQHPEPLGPIAVDYYCQRGPDAPLPNLYWTSRSIQLNMPRFAVRPVFDRLEDQTKRDRKVFSISDAAAFSRRKSVRHAITAVAASITVAAALWVGASAGKAGRGMLSRGNDEIASAPVGSGAAALAEARAQDGAGPMPSPISHPVAWVKASASKRAVVRLGDTFQEGMAAWGAKGKSLVAGWSSSSDGYVRPGQLALFQPSVKFTDYRMEFFGQLESKSMSWVVRGKDPKNYYAMKFDVVQPGLRPIISMVHYPVVEGKPGKKVEMPLSVMVHNDTPYHVAVDVKGSHYVASIEGQEVDEWTDDSLMAGGVGFFSEAGARARIYWMKVSKNDDWFGHLCGYIAGNPDSDGQTASLDRPEVPLPAPSQPAPVPATAVIWSAEAAATGWGRSQRGRASTKRGTERWSS